MRGMSNELVSLHYDAAFRAGREKSCGNKVDHRTYERALVASYRLNDSGHARHEVEPYPCPFCQGWHVGNKMSEEEFQELLKKNLTTAPKAV